MKKFENATFNVSIFVDAVGGLAFRDYCLGFLGNGVFGAVAYF